LTQSGFFIIVGQTKAILGRTEKRKGALKMLRKVILIAAIILLSSSGALAIHLPFLHRQSLFDVGFGSVGMRNYGSIIGHDASTWGLGGTTGAYHMGLDIGYQNQMVEGNWPQYGGYSTAAQIVRHRLWRTMLFDRPGSNSLVTKALRANMGHSHLINDPLWLNYIWLRAD